MIGALKVLLFPKAIADKMELFLSGLVGYAIEFSVQGRLIEISDGIYFDRYKTKDILEVQAEAWNKSSQMKISSFGTFNLPKLS